MFNELNTYRKLCDLFISGVNLNKIQIKNSTRKILLEITRKKN